MLEQQLGDGLALPRSVAKKAEPYWPERRVGRGIGQDERQQRQRPCEEGSLGLLGEEDSLLGDGIGGKESAKV